MLAHEPASEVEDVFCQTFEVEWTEFGAKRTHEVGRAIIVASCGAVVAGARRRLRISGSPPVAQRGRLAAARAGSRASTGRRDSSPGVGGTTHTTAAPYKLSRSRRAAARPTPAKLVAGGRDLAVTGANRAEYVERRARWILSDSIAAQFDAFRRGFERVVRPPRAGDGGKSSSLGALLSAGELEALVEGAAEVTRRALVSRSALRSGRCRVPSRRPFATRAPSPTHGPRFGQTPLQPPPLTQL